MLRTTAIAGVLAGAALLTGCAADITVPDPTDQGPAQAEQVSTPGDGRLETTDAGKLVEGMETTGEAQEALTPWQKVCVLGCATFAGAGCASVSMSCTAGTLWSFGGILIPCTYAVVAACGGAASLTTVCTIKCVGG